MISGPSLRQWLDDPQAQQDSLDRVEACADRWGLHPLMTQLERELREMKVLKVDSLLDSARRFIDRSGDIEALVRDLIDGSRADPFSRPPFRAISSDIHEALLLFHSAPLSIALGVTPVDRLAARKSGRRGSTSVGFTGVVSLYRYVRSGDAAISLWEAPPITDSFAGAEAGSCRPVGMRRLRDGDELVSDGRRESFVIEHARSDIVYFQAVIRADAAPVSVEYDSSTRKFLAATSTDEASSRVEMMVSLLRVMDRRDALPLIVELLDSPNFHTRWHVMRELVAIDSETALPPLRRMAVSDPHPEVRAAAALTLDRFFADHQDAAPCPA